MKKILFFIFLIISFSFASEELVQLNTRDNITQKFSLIENDNAIATLILFAGGKGALDLSFIDRKVVYGWGKNNFLVRTRELFSQNQFNIAIIDAPSDMQTKNGMYGGFRKSIEHKIDIDKVISYLKNKFSVPIWLVGTSRGTVSATNLAINTDIGIDGLVLSSSITVENKKGPSILNMNLERISVPVLIVAHKDDGCSITPSKNAIEIKKQLINSKNVEVKLFDGGKKGNKPCKAKSFHGYFGIEKNVVEVISKYIKERIL